MKYSIITVNFNNKAGLSKTLESILSQSCKDYELIVIDGGSTDGSKDLLEAHRDHIDYWVSEPDKGIYNGMNKGIQKARGEFINFMNSGDTFYDKTTLQQVTEQMDGSDILVGSDYNVDPKTGASAMTVLPLRVSMATFFVQTFPHQSSFIRRSLFDNCLYDEQLRIVADWKFFLDKVVYENCSVKLLHMPVSLREQDGISNTQSERTTEERTEVLTQLLPPGIYKDYASLAQLDRSTLYKLLNLCELPKARKLLTLVIKILNRLLSSERQDTAQK